MGNFSRRFFLGGTAAALPLGLSGSFIPSRLAAEYVTGQADMLVVGKILTMNSYTPVVEAMAIKGDRILAVGDLEEVLPFAGASTERIDARNHTITPGFIDAHSHPLFAEEAVGVNVNLPRIEDVKKVLAQKAAQTPPGHWVRGVMYDDTKFIDERPLNRKDIDQAVKNHPVYVAHRGGHTAVVNSRALEISGITMDTPDPVGGKFYRENGEFTGKVAEHAIDAFFKVGVWPIIDRSVRQEAARISSQNMAASGLTSTTDAFGTRDDLIAYQDARRNNQLHFRVSFMPKGGSEIFDGLKTAGIGSGFGDEMIRIGAVKYSADGSASERTMSMSTPYQGKPNDFGILTMTQDEIYEAVDDAVAHDFRVGIHANGDVAINMVLNAYEKVLKNHKGVNPRHRIEHCSLVNDELLVRIKAAGVIPTPFYTYVYYHGNKWVDYGYEKMQKMFAHRSFLDAGIPVAPASDYTPGPYEPMMAIQSMVTRKDVRGRVWGPDQKISVSDAMRICTMHGAYASFEEDLQGSLEAGKLADFVILEKDPHEVNPDEIVNIKILKTVLGGKTTFEG
ncbi:MAG: amidohydrolase [Pseudomonadota bacterium]|nr:amidohydrolase [Pseudomonadota bacterium]